MKIRPVNRRNFSVEPAGYFNVLAPSKRFTPAQPSGDFPYLTSRIKGTASPQAYENPATAPAFGLIPRSEPNNHGYSRLLRPALIVVAATALTLFLLWWSTGLPRHLILWPPSQ